MDLGDPGCTSREIAVQPTFFARTLSFPYQIASNQHVVILKNMHFPHGEMLEEWIKMKRLAVLMCACVLGMTSASAFAGSDKAKLDGRLDDAATVLDQVMVSPDKTIPSGILANATCVAVVPAYKKAAFILGAQYGQGVVTCHTNHGWSAPAFIQFAGGSFGWQIGGQSTDLVLVAVNEKGFQDLLKSKFKIGADASAAAGPVGRSAQASTNLTMHSEMLSYSRNRGLFAGADLSGTTVTQNTDDTRTFYGTKIPFPTILGGGVATPGGAQKFVRTVAKYFVSSKVAHP